MKWPLRVVAVLLLLLGVVWILQGINVLGRSFMSGQPPWALAGAGCIIVGGALLAFGSRLRKPRG